jgi:hypothetical protein
LASTFSAWNNLYFLLRKYRSKNYTGRFMKHLKLALGYDAKLLVKIDLEFYQEE